MQTRFRALAKGLATRLPLLRQMANSSTGGTCSARYCYSVWMRHFGVVSEAIGVIRPSCIAELGPGDSLGIGLTAMLCGVQRYFALDRKAFADIQTNLNVFDELVELVRARTPIPDDAEFPGVFPKLSSYAFPTKLLDDSWLTRCLEPKRVDSIRCALSRTRHGADGIELRYFAPWDDSATILPESVDWVFSQAVLEHVDDVDGTYANLAKWMRRDGVMSASIDYSCHGLTRDWNGHWTVQDGMWRAVRGQRAYLINRLPHSAHLRSIHEAGLHVVHDLRSSARPLPRSALAPRFRELPDEDLSTASAFIVATKPSGLAPNRT